MSTLLVLGYAFMVGGDAAVVRAAVMGGLALFAVTVGRRPNGLNSLAFVGAIMALFNPHILWDVSFQLSFMATLGLVLFAGPFSDVFSQMITNWWGAGWAARLTGPIGEYILFTLAAQLTTLPVILAQFERLSAVALLANPLILPAQPLVMATGGLALLSGLLFQPLGQLFAWIAWPFTRHTIAVVEGLGRIPGAAWVTGPVAPAFLFGFTALILVVGLFWEPMKGLVRRLMDLLGGRAVFLALLTLAVSATLVWQIGLNAPDGRMHLYILDTGGGEGLLIQTSGGRYVLVNGGARASLLSAELGRRLPLFDRHVDWLVIGGTRDEQIGALPVTAERYLPGAVLWTGPTAGSSSARALYRQLTEAPVQIVEPQVGQALDLGDGARLEYLAVTPRGAVFLLEWDDFRALLPVGMDFDAMEALLELYDLAPLSALLLGDSGYAPLNPPELIAHLQPQVVLLSVVAGNNQGLPSSETLQAVQGYNLLRTDRNGWIELTTDGDQMWVEVERR
jgi:competence protein ComEC